jgi:antirestriction protein
MQTATATPTACADTGAEFRIYAACLASYNAGRLFGAWIDCDGKTGEEIGLEIADMLARSPCPNVMRRKCPDCGHYQTDSRPYRDNDSDCDNCGAALPAEFKPSAEEWAIHDHEGFGDLIKTEWPDIDELAELVAFMEGADDNERRAFRWLVDDLGRTVADAIERAPDVSIYDGEAADYAAEFAEDCYSAALDAMPDFLKFHIDWQGVARDLLIGGDIAQAEDAEGRFIVTNASEF